MRLEPIDEIAILTAALAPKIERLAPSHMPDLKRMNLWTGTIAVRMLAHPPKLKRESKGPQLLSLAEFVVVFEHSHEIRDRSLHLVRDLLP